MAELRKVIWPGRRELITYTTVVIVFVAFIVALVAGLDLLFAKGVIAVFGCSPVPRQRSMTRKRSL